MSSRYGPLRPHDPDISRYREASVPEGTLRRFKIAIAKFPKPKARLVWSTSPNSLDGTPNKSLVDRPCRKRRSTYTEGEVNKLIDGFLHPIARQDPYYWVVDTVLHGLVEQDPAVTLDKFIRYNLPKILDQAMKNQRRKTGRKTSYSY